jgi:hypothetical protein
MDEGLVRAIHEYLLMHGEGWMLEIFGDDSCLSAFATDHDMLGWEKFLEDGSREPVSLQLDHLCPSQS